MSPFEKPSNESELLNEAEAHEEANMMRVGMEGKEPTPEDYDKALQEIEELKALAEQDPTGVKLMDKVKELAETSADKLMFLAAFIPGSSVTAIALFIGEGNLKETANHERYEKAMLEGFSSATEKLRRLKTESERKGGQ